MNDSPILEVRHACRYYPSGEGWVKALDDVSLELYPGELLGITGPSGSGKSTLLLIAGLLEAPTHGEVWFDSERVAWPGVAIDRLRAFRRRRIGFIFQKANLIPFLTAAENVALALCIDAVPPAAARDHALWLLDALGLGHRVDNLPARLSGGEQQRVAIARALANDPRLLLADEPTAALDARRGRQVMALLREIASTRGAGVAVVTHDPRTLELFDRVVTLEDGRMQADQGRG